MVRLRVVSVFAVMLAVLPLGAMAQSSGGANIAAAPNADQPVHPQVTPAEAVSVPLQGMGPAPAPSPGSCDREIAGARLGTPSSIIVQLDPDTLWRPPGSEVRFTIAGLTGTPPAVSRVFACFRWELADHVPKAGDPADPGYVPSTLVRGIPRNDGVIEYGAMVPQLRRSPDGFAHDSGGEVQYQASHTVPVADMQVLIELGDGHWVAVVLPVGVTNWLFAVGLLVILLVVTCFALWWLAEREIERCRAALGAAAAPPQGPRLRRFFRSISRHLLAVISDDQNIASLSQLQVMVWTFLVAGAAIYVMALSGNLIAISGGTLTLLGIAGGTLVVAQIDPKTPPPVAAWPSWAQLLQKDATTQNIDVTRLQMLIFTLITAVFVAIKVAASYSIPEIPDNFLVLMGISNGVYLAGRKS